PEESVAATYSQGSLRVTVPYAALHNGPGKLTVEVLDPEEKVLARAERQVEITTGKGQWRGELKPASAPAVGELVWQRLRYRFEYDGQKDAALEGTESISEILRRPVMHILGQQSYLSGGPAAVRVIATDSNNQPIAGSNSVRIELLIPDQKPRVLFTGSLN